MPYQKQPIIQILDSRHMGGIESHVLELTLGLQKSGWSVKVVFLQDYGDHPLQRALSQRAIPYLCLDGTLKAVWSLMRHHKNSLWHTHGYKAGLMARLCALALKTPVISTYHAGEKTRGKLALYTALDRLSAVFSTPIAVSKQIAARLPTKAHLLNNFVTIPPRTHHPSQGTRIAFVGRLSPEKGPDIFCSLAALHPELSFHVYGDGPLRDALEDEYGQHIHFHGHVAMRHHWDQVDLLCMTSRFEGLPMAALEAMARGIPVLATDVGALPRLIRNHKTGWIIPMDHLADFHIMLTRWTNLSAQQRLTMGQAAQQTIQDHYSPDVIIPKVEAIYHQAIGG